MSTRILLTGGRAPVTLELARLLAAADCTVYVAESLAHHLCHYSHSVTQSFLVPSPRYQPKRYINALIEIIKQCKIDWLIPTCEEIFYVARGLSQLNPLCQIFVESLPKLHRLHNKWTFIDRLNQWGILAPKTSLLQSQTDLLEFLVTSPFETLILKPVYSRFASNIHILSQPFPQIPSLEISANYAWIAQEFIVGKQFCTYSIAHQGQLMATAIYPNQLNSDRDPCIYFESINHPQLISWLSHFVELEQFTGQIAFDFIETPTGDLYPLECNPRATSGIHLFQVSDRLEQAFFNSTDHLIQPQNGSKAMIAAAMLGMGLRQSIASHQFPKWLQKFFTTKDVIFHLSDPLPFVYLGLVLFQFWQISKQHRVSLQQASTYDIEWNGEGFLPINFRPTDHE